MIKRLMKISAPLVACALVFATCQVASAFPGSGSDCSVCHGGTTDGDLSISPNPIDISVNDTGDVTFDITDNPSTASVALYGLEAAGLDVTSLGAGWTDAGTYVYSDNFSGTETDPVLSLGIGPAAVEALYGVDVTLAGGSGLDTGRWMSTYNFDVNVIPEPTTLVLLGMAGVGLCFLKRRR